MLNVYNSTSNSSHLSSFVLLSCCLVGSSVGNSSSEGFVGVLVRAGSHTRSEVEYMHKGGQKSILTDFYSDRQLQFKRNQSLEQQLSFELDN